MYTDKLVYIPKKSELTQESRSKIGLAYFCGTLGENGIDSLVNKGWLYNPFSEDAVYSSPPMISKTSYNLYGAGIVLLLLLILKLLLWIGERFFEKNRYTYYITVAILLSFSIYRIREFIKNVE